MASDETRGVLRLRVMHGRRVAIGPGKADLLEGIEATGSIAAAGRAMRMSYKRAWQLVEEMNACFRTPVVEASKGGSGGGGAGLTRSGRAVLARYRAIERACAEAARADLSALRRQLAE